MTRGLSLVATGRATSLFLTYTRRPSCPRVPQEVLVQQLVNDCIVKTARRCFPVTADGQVVGIVTLRHIAGVPQEQWGALMVG